MWGKFQVHAPLVHLAQSTTLLDTGAIPMCRSKANCVQTVLTGNYALCFL